MEEPEICIVCGRTSREANLVSALIDKEKEIQKVCESCAVVENAVIIPNPTKKQIAETEVPYTVYERLVRMSGIKPREMPEYARQREVKVKADKISNISISTLQEMAKQKQEKEKQEKQEARKKPIEIIREGNEKHASIDFSSQDIKINDLLKLKRKISQ